MCSDLSVLPLPVWGEGWGEGVTERSLDLNPSPHPSPSRSRIYPTSADLMCRTRVNPSSVGEGADRARCFHRSSSIMLPVIVKVLHAHEVYVAAHFREIKLRLLSAAL